MAIKEQGFRLSPQQRHMVRSGSDREQICFTMTLSGPIDQAGLREKFGLLIDRHEVLRTQFKCPETSRFPVQVIQPESDSFSQISLQITQSKEGWRLTATLSALALDLAAVDILSRDFLALCAGSSVAEPILQYADASEWFNQQLEDLQDRADAFWQERTRAGAGPLDALTCIDCAEPASLAIGKQRTKAVYDICDHHGVDPAALMLVCWARTLASTPINPAIVQFCFDGRIYPELDDLAGPVEIFAPVKTTAWSDTSIIEAARLQMVENSSAEQHLFEFDSSRGSPSAGFRMQALPEERTDGAYRVKVESVRMPPAPSDTTLWVRPEGDDLHLEIQQPETGDSYYLAQPEKLIERFLAVLDAALAAPMAPLSRLPASTSEDDMQLLSGLNGRRRETTPPASIVERVRLHAQELGNQPAILSQDKEVSYQELLDRALTFAGYLADVGLAAEDVVAIYSDQTVDWYTAVLGIWIAGGVCLAIDPTVPQKRADAEIEISRVRFAVRLTPGYAAPDSVKMLSFPPPPGSSAMIDPPLRSTLSGLAFVTFTSGTTGRPKGVATEHGNLAHYARAMAELLKPLNADRHASPAAPSVDLGMTSWLVALWTGGTVVVLPPEARLSAEKFAAANTKLAVDYLKITPSHLSMILQSEHVSALPAKGLILGGEELPAGLVRTVWSLAPSLSVINHYGPSETTVGALAQVLDADSLSGDAAGLGQALSSASVLPDDTVPLPLGQIKSELWIGGDTVARGYLNAPAETAERFRPDPRAQEPGRRVFLSGDLIRLREDGKAIFAGRVDDQVKILGHRVELSEVNAALMSQSSVHRAATLVVGSGVNQRLEAFVEGDAALDCPAVLAALAQILPKHSVPSNLHDVEQLPMLASGKVDRKALLALSIERRRPRRAPAGFAETVISEIFADVLSSPVDDAHASFFDIGGHSLLATLAIARLREELGLDLEIETFFRSPTVAALAELAQARIPERLKIVEEVYAMTDDEIEQALVKRQD
ncbi:non-ribosomal peptide synthetase [Roseovarius sp. M141]|uniref:non-ribosomal peptide synthetase n=1 Tax=Roseovarius sp. M141 TaxID=2583806 RepID=UPI0020CC3E16|nr:non-ribosomal peptide synthetase [Roseovarius sp. M141]MCQ0090771.1 AMP-binding protein [Roseovarius sp. M141]